jgi:DNA-binding MarR family transcriptional regulator
MTYTNVIWTYKKILENLNTKTPTKGGDLKKETGLFSSELTKYTAQLEEMNAIEKKQVGKLVRPLVYLTPTGVEMLYALCKLYNIMELKSEA